MNKNKEIKYYIPNSTPKDPVEETSITYNPYLTPEMHNLALETVTEQKLREEALEVTKKPGYIKSLLNGIRKLNIIKIIKNKMFQPDTSAVIIVNEENGKVSLANDPRKHIKNILKENENKIKEYLK
jgi:hypothetical protein